MELETKGKQPLSSSYRNATKTCTFTCTIILSNYILDSRQREEGLAKVNNSKHPNTERLQDAQLSNAVRGAAFSRAP